jgi:hypothetical protein
MIFEKKKKKKKKTIKEREKKVKTGRNVRTTRGGGKIVIRRWETS